MGKRVVFVLLLGGCFNVGSCDLSFTPSPCEDLVEDGANCNPSHSACFSSPCQCTESYIVVCPKDLSVRRDLSPSPRDLAPPNDSGGFD
ncbi:MAG: hypothetical protein JWM53_6955 [bacterium]|nr:hypothetical protein [bacterium]